jgi:hypothetical protein
VRSQIFSRASGQFGNIDGLIVVREQPDDLNSAEQTATGRLETGLIDGITSTRTTAVGAEATDTESSSISFFQSRDISSVDDLDLVAGRVALVFSLLGAEGSFGVKDSADRLLPDLLTPEPIRPTPESTSIGAGRSGAGDGQGGSEESRGAPDRGQEGTAQSGGGRSSR